MLDLTLAVLCSLAIGVIFKISARHGLDRIALLTVNYAAAAVVAVGLLSADPARGFGALHLEGLLVLLGVVTGALFILGFFLLAWATELAGMSLALGVMRVSVVIPVLASWGLWDEVPSTAQGIGLAIAGMAFFLIARRRAGRHNAAATASAGRVFAVLALLFVVGGIVDVTMKTFEEVFAARNSSALFLLFVFTVAFAIGAVLVGRKRQRTGRWPERATIAWGGVLGVVNYGSAAFLLRAIQQLEAPFVFPANNIAVMIGAALIGVLIWRERLAWWNWLGLGLAALALVLLNVNGGV